MKVCTIHKRKKYEVCRMLRQFLHSFQRSLTLHSAPRNTSRGNIPYIAAGGHIEFRRTLFHIENAQSKATDNGEAAESAEAADDDTAPINSEGDTEYIVPYRVERERCITTNAFIEALRTCFRLSADDEERLRSDEVVKRRYKQHSLLQTLDALCLEGVSKRSFIDHPWLISMDKKRLDQKLVFLRTLPMRDFNHFVPFLRLTVPRLRKLVSALNCESDLVPLGNRVYYISNKLHMDAYVVSMYLSKRLFILEMPFDMLEQNLEHMLNYNVSPLNILKDLWAFRYTPKSVQLRLERAKRAKKDKIMPWMVRCPESILQRSLKISMDELAVLGGKASTVEYLAEKLKFSVEEAKAIMNRHPQVYTVRVTKMKEVLDYLLDEAGFTRFEVAQVPRILCHSLETTKERLEELAKHDCRPSSLVIVCRSKREYDKFLRAWMVMKSKGYVPTAAAAVAAEEFSQQKSTSDT